jgi:hypothetical protein
MKSTSSIFKNFISNGSAHMTSTEQSQHQSAGFSHSPKHHHIHHQHHHIHQQQPHHQYSPHNEMKTSLNAQKVSHQHYHHHHNQHQHTALNSNSVAQSTQSTSNMGGSAVNNLRLHTNSCSNMSVRQQQHQQQQSSTDYNTASSNSNSTSSKTPAVAETIVVSSPAPPSSSYLLNKMGRTFLIGYLGSAILTKGKTGLGSLQQPLRELYCIFRQSNSRLIQERRLVVSVDGLTMIYNELGIEKCLHNDLSFVYDVELLQLVCDHKKDKKLHCAFLPLGKNIEF